MQFYPSKNVTSWDSRPMNQTVPKSLLRWKSRDASKNFGNKKTKNHSRVIFRPFAGTHPLGRSVWILACRVISPT